MRKMLTTIAIAIVTTCMASCERESIQIVGYVDLGLPSGTQWKEKNEVNPADSVYNLYTYDEAMAEFGEQLPTKEQFEELKSVCYWSWNGSGYKVTGPNGKSIVLPASGWYGYDERVGEVGVEGSYWSSTPTENYAWYLHFYSENVGMYNSARWCGRTVRLVHN